MEVIRRKIRVNGKEYTEYVYNNKVYKNLSDLLVHEFNTHGEFYKKIFNVSEQDAAYAGWLPSWSVFLPTNAGFAEFIKNKGRIQKEVYEETISLKQAVEEELFKD